MIEKQRINDKDVWIKITPVQPGRANAHVIPAEYFTASYFFQEPADDATGEVIKEDNGEAKLFESPVAALSFAGKKLTSVL